LFTSLWGGKGKKKKVAHDMPPQISVINIISLVPSKEGGKKKKKKADAYACDSHKKD